MVSAGGHSARCTRCVHTVCTGEKQQMAVRVRIGHGIVRIGRDSVRTGHDSVGIGRDSVRTGHDSVRIGRGRLRGRARRSTDPPAHGIKAGLAPAAAVH